MDVVSWPCHQKRRTFLESEQEFLARLRVGPAVLFLGQNYLALESGRDPVLELIDTKYGLGDGPGDHGFLTGGFPTQGDAAVQWLDVQSSKLPQPAWLGVVAAFPWSALYTSAVDSAWIESFSAMTGVNSSQFMTSCSAPTNRATRST